MEKRLDLMPEASTAANPTINLTLEECVVSGASRRAAQEMTDLGITRIRAWSKPIKINAFTYRLATTRPKCDKCAKFAGYNTPWGVLCYTHTIEHKDAGK